MFNNVGKKIQRISTVVFWLQTIICILIGIALWGALADDDRGFVGFITFLSVSAGGGFAAWLSQLMLQAYGKITECCEQKLDMSNSSTATPTNITPNSSTNFFGNNKDGSWCCTCGRKNSSYVSTCTCGTNKRELIMKNHK